MSETNSTNPTGAAAQTATGTAAATAAATTAAVAANPTAAAPASAANDNAQRTFTQAEVNQIIADRLARERRANPTAELDNLRAEVEQLKTAAAVRDIRDKVAGEKSVPVKLLTGSTEAECTAQADAILAFAAQQQGKPYPAVPDGGEVGKNGSGGTTRDQFAEWFAANIKVI